ncbi:MAG: transposase [Promethearchaeota archaeon]
MKQYYKKQRARYSSLKDKQGLGFENRRLQKLAMRRNNRINDAFHKISRAIVRYCVSHGFGSF